MEREIKPIRVLVVDDNQMVRKGLRLLLDVTDDMELVGEAKDGDEAIALSKTTHPCVILMDLVMPEMCGTQATSQIRKQDGDVKIILLTGYHDQSLIQAGLEAGANEYASKHSSVDDLLSLIRAV